MFSEDNCRKHYIYISFPSAKQEGQPALKRTQHHRWHCHWLTHLMNKHMLKIKLRWRKEIWNINLEPLIEDYCTYRRLSSIKKKSTLTYQRKVCMLKIFTWLLVNLPCWSQSIKTGPNPGRVLPSHHRIEHIASSVKIVI